MELQLSVVVHVTLDEKQARLVTTGSLTETNQQVLYPLIHRARTLTSETRVVIDLSAVEHFEAAALDLLCWEVELDRPGSFTEPVRFVLPDSPPAGGPWSAPESKT